MRGFLAAAGAAGDQSNCIVIPHGEDGVLAAFEDARARNVKIIGPLLRDDLKAVAQLALTFPSRSHSISWTKARHRHPTSTRSRWPSRATRGLIARRIRAEGVPSVAVVGAETPLMKRFASAFATEWLAEGGPMPDVYRFDGTQEALTAMRRDLVRRKTTNAVLLAVDSTSATLAKPASAPFPRMQAGSYSSANGR